MSSSTVWLTNRFSTNNSDYHGSWESSAGNPWEIKVGMPSITLHCLN